MNKLIKKFINGFIIYISFFIYLIFNIIILNLYCGILIKKYFFNNRHIITFEYIHKQYIE